MFTTPPYDRRTQWFSAFIVLLFVAWAVASMLVGAFCAVFSAFCSG